VSQCAVDVDTAGTTGTDSDLQSFVVSNRGNSSQEGRATATATATDVVGTATTATYRVNIELAHAIWESEVTVVGFDELVNRVVNSTDFLSVGEWLTGS
jgi:hypothetical protein